LLCRTPLFGRNELSYDATLADTSAGMRPPNDYIGGKRKPMRRTGTHSFALSASSARPALRSSDRGFARVIGFPSQQNQPGSGLKKSD
jgi:hypothetical protein